MEGCGLFISPFLNKLVIGKTLNFINGNIISMRGHMHSPDQIIYGRFVGKMEAMTDPDTTAQMRNIQITTGDFPDGSEPMLESGTVLLVYE